jgi:hypothetical protein
MERCIHHSLIVAQNRFISLVFSPINYGLSAEKCDDYYQVVSGGGSEWAPTETITGARSNLVDRARLPAGL